MKNCRVDVKQQSLTHSFHRTFNFYDKKCFIILNYFYIIGKDSSKVDGTRMHDKHKESYREK